MKWRYHYNNNRSRGVPLYFVRLRQPESLDFLVRLHQPKSSAFRDIFPYLGHARAHDNDFPVLSIWVMRARMTSYILPVYAVALDFRVFSTISSFDFNRLGSNLISMFIRIFAMFVQKNFVRHRFVTKIRAKIYVPARRNSRAPRRNYIRALYLHGEATPRKIPGYKH